METKNLDVPATIIELETRVLTLEKIMEYIISGKGKTNHFNQQKVDHFAQEAANEIIKKYQSLFESQSPDF